jgi:hypothetical protein
MQFDYRANDAGALGELVMGEIIDEKETKKQRAELANAIEGVG